ncbi:MAG: DUF2065 domain-containing protein [Hyphomicrobiaceae bacterium]
MADLIVAMGLVFVIEGLIWAIFPGYARSVLEAVAEMPENSVRTAAVAAIAVGVVIVWLAKG